MEPTAFPSLTVLKLGGNKDLAGQLPAQLLGPPKLAGLDLSSCSLQGPLPTSLPAGLLNLSLAHNSFSGMRSSRSMHVLCVAQVGSELKCECRHATFTSMDRSAAAEHTAEQQSVGGALSPAERYLTSCAALSGGPNTPNRPSLMLQGSLANQAAQLGSLVALDVSFNHFVGAHGLEIGVSLACKLSGVGCFGEQLWSMQAKCQLGLCQACQSFRRYSCKAMS